MFSLSSMHDDLMMRALVWLCMVQFRAIWFGTSYANLRWPRIFTAPNFRKNTLSSIWAN